MRIISNDQIDLIIEAFQIQHESKLNRLFLDLKKSYTGLENLSQKQRFEQLIRISFASQLNLFAKTMNLLLFNQSSGIFKNDIDKLNELNYDQLYCKMTIWFSWKRIPIKPGDKEYRECVSTSMSSLENCLGISSDEAKIYYTNLNEISAHLIDFALYQWCMLDIGHIDTNYESMHENSPDCKKFIQTIVVASAEVEQIY